jgi:hypothetical protein
MRQKRRSASIAVFVRPVQDSHCEIGGKAQRRRIEALCGV